MFSELKWVNALLYGFINDINGLNFRYDLHDFDVEAYQISKYLPETFMSSTVIGDGLGIHLILQEN